MTTFPSRRAFSLLEIMAVITLVGVVAAVTMYRLNNLDLRAANETVIKQNVNQLQNAVERFRFDQNVFPSTLEDLVTAGVVTTIPSETDFFEYRYDPATGLVGYVTK